jgi:transcriptional regulator with XRE-family HTH domain
MTVGMFLKDLRKQSGLSIREVVRQSNGCLDKTAISRIEMGDRGISFKAAYALSKIYKIDIAIIAEQTFVGNVDISNTHFNTSSDERALIDIYRLLPKKQKRVLFDIVFGLSQTGDAVSVKDIRKKISAALCSLRTH